jgi:pimeloyl-ACP methyl ester carboxylesterase
MQLVVDDILTNYQIFGDKNKKPFLILHGWQRSVDEWNSVAKTLEDSYRVILLDLPGFGKTAKPAADFSIYDYSTFVEHFLDKLGFKKTILLGHSLGARLGIILATNTNKVEKLILVSPAGIEKKSFFSKIKVWIFKSGKIFLPKTTTENLKQKMGSDDYKAANEMRSTFIKIISEDLSYLLPKINIPTLLIWGNKDTIIPMWKIKQMKQIIPNAKLRVTWESGHFPHIEKPREFIEILKDYL